MKLSYYQKENIMKIVFAKWQSPASFRSSYKGVPMEGYESIKQYIDFTKYYVMFRGPRPLRSQSSTRKRHAKAFDLYQFSDRDVRENRIEREAFQRGVEYGHL
jgi:hypothetical protein